MGKWVLTQLNLIKLGLNWVAYWVSNKLTQAHLLIIWGYFCHFHRVIFVILEMLGYFDHIHK